MRICKNCNVTVSDEDKFCPTCGGAVLESLNESESNPTNRDEPKNKKRRIALPAIITAAIVLLAVAAVFVYQLAFNTPDKQFLRAQADILSPFEPYMMGEADRPSVDISTDMTMQFATDNALINSMLQELTLGLKLDINNDSGLMNFDISYKNTPALTGSLVTDKDMLGFYLPELDENYYTMTMEESADAADLDEMLGVFGYEPVAEEELLDFAPVPNIAKAYKNITKRYSRILMVGINKNNVTLEKNVALELSDIAYKYSKVKLYTFKPDYESAAAMLRMLAEELRKDEELASYLVTLLNHYSDAYGNEEMNKQLYTYIMNSLNDIADAVEEELADPTQSEQNFAESNLKWELAIANGEIVLQRVLQGDHVIEYQHCAEDGIVSNAFKFNVEDGEDVFFVSNMAEKAGKMSGTINIKLPDDVNLVINVTDFEGEKKSALGIGHGKFEIVFSGINAEDIVLTFNVGEAEENGTDHRLTVSGLDIDLGNGMGRLNDITVSLNTSDAESTAVEPTVDAIDISGYTDEQINEIANGMVEELANVLTTVLIGMLGGVM